MATGFAVYWGKADQSTLAVRGGLQRYDSQCSYGECCVRTYGTNSERRLRTLSLMVASGLMPFGFRRQYDWSLMGYPV